MPAFAPTAVGGERIIAYTITTAIAFAAATASSKNGQFTSATDIVRKDGAYDEEKQAYNGYPKGQF